MRIRSIRPEFWSSEDVAALDWETRLVFIGLWSYVDDNGVGRDVEKLITADLFPLEDDPRETLARVSRALARLAEAYLITRYTVGGKPYLHIDSWERHQKIDRPAKDRYPLPTSENAARRETLATPSRHLRDTPSTGEGEKGRRGEGEKEETQSEPDRFDAFWAAYPKRTAKPDARKKWAAAVRKTTPDVIMAGLARYRFNPDPQFIPHPATWLNQERWADEPAQPGQRLRLAGPGGERKWTKTELDEVLGAEQWFLPQPPTGMSPDDRWNWERELRLDHIADRVRRAEAKLSGVAAGS